MKSLRKTVRQAVPVQAGELWRQFVSLAENLGLRHPPRLVLSRDSCGPAAFGVLQPTVILPEKMAELEAASLNSVLSHELAHLRRRDPWINWIQLALAAVWWFNPIVWLLNRQIRKVREDCCDDLLLNMQLTTGDAYCQTLLSAASHVSDQPSAGVALGFGDGRHPLARRFERIMDQTLRRARGLTLTGVILLALLACLVLPGLRRLEGDQSGSTSRPAQSPEPGSSVPVENFEWPAGQKVSGRVLDHEGAPVADAEILMLGEERVTVSAEKQTWFVRSNQSTKPSSTRTNQHGEFVISRSTSATNRLGIIPPAPHPLFWVVSRKDLGDSGHVEIRLPAAGSLQVGANFPRLEEKLPVMITLESFDGTTWDGDSLMFHQSGTSLTNFGETIFERLPPAHYSVQRYFRTKIEANSGLISPADRQLVQIEPRKQARLHFERQAGQRLTGRVLGMENVELRYAHLSIQYLGPEEISGKNQHKSRMFVNFDVIPLSDDSSFAIEDIPPGEYYAMLHAVRASSPRLMRQSADFSAHHRFTVPETGDPPEIEIVAEPSKPRDLSQVTDLRVRVVDEEGKPIPKLEGMVHTGEAGYSFWERDNSGLFFLGGIWDRRNVPVQVALRAEGYASTITHFPVDQHEAMRKGEATMTLQRGELVQLKFQIPEGMTWPPGVIPDAYFDELQNRARMMRQPSNRRLESNLDFNLLNLKEIGEGTFEFRLADNTPRFHIGVHAPGFLQFFEAGPFTRDDVKDGRLTIPLPRPASLEISFQPGRHSDAGSLFKSASLSILRANPDKSYLEVTSVSDSALAPTLKLTDLAPGTFHISAATAPQQEKSSAPGSEVNLGQFHDTRDISLGEGQVEQIHFEFVPYQPDGFRGDRDAVLRIQMPDGRPARGRKVAVRWFDRHYGAQVVHSGTVPDSGEIKLTGLTDRTPPLPGRFLAYHVIVDDIPIGYFDFVEDSGVETFDIFLPPDQGDLAPDVEFTNLTTGVTTSLRSFQGKVVLLEFWATWCGPCQEPMAKLNAMVKERRAELNDQFVVVPVSLDADDTTVRSHVQIRDWTAVDHFRSGDGAELEFESPAAKAFVIRMVPTTLLIDRDGRILWRGHPLEKELETQIEAALK